MRFPFEHSLPTALVRVDRATGECVLQRREDAEGDGVYELILNGKLLMDSSEHASEEALAEIGLRECGDGRDLEVLVGGLGFGFTLQAVLRDPRVVRAVVVELEPLLLSFLARQDVRAELPVPNLADPRVVAREGNVREWIAAAGGDAYDVILLDVDNGPQSLSAVGNLELYSEAGLRQCWAALRPGGVLAIWSSEPAPGCLSRLAACFEGVREWVVPVQRERRRIDYRILSGRRANTASTSPPDPPARG
jgi:spermidine synthase